MLALCSTVAATVLWFHEFFFFFFNNWFVFFVFFFFLNIDVSWHLYCYTATTNFTIFLIYIKSGYATTMHCSCKSATVLWFRESAFFFFFFLSNRFVFFFSFKYWCKLTFILLYWHNKFHNIFTIIDMSIYYKSK